MKTVRLTVAREEAGERLDRWLAARVGELSRTLARRVLQEGGVFVGGRRTRIASRSVRAGEEVVVHVPPAALLALRWPEPAVLHRDPVLLVADKPPGQPVQPTRVGDYGSLETSLARALKREAAVVRALHRLDAGTSGLVAFTLEPPSARQDRPEARRARRALRSLFREHGAERVYLAVAAAPDPPWKEGEERRVDLPLVRRGRGVRVVPAGVRGAMEACTLVRLERVGVGPGGCLALLVVRPRTGRLHQVRAHIATAGLRLVGEKRYLPEGPPPEGAPAFARPALHAWRLRLDHPLTGRPLRLEAPLPADLAELVPGCP